MVFAQLSPTQCLTSGLVFQLILVNALVTFVHEAWRCLPAEYQKHVKNSVITYLGVFKTGVDLKGGKHATSLKIYYRT